MAAPAIFGILESIVMVLMKSKHSTLHIFEGLAPNLVFIVYYLSLFLYSDLLWTYPALSLLNLAPFFCLATSRLIVSTVAKMKFTLLREIHLSLPMLLTIVIFPLNKHYKLGLNELYVYIALIIMNYYAFFLFVVNAID